MQQFEEQEQMAIFAWAAYMEGQYPDLKRLYAIPNGGYRNKATAGRLKAAGVKAGVPDMCLPVPRGRYHGLYIELKYGKNKPSEAQNDWLRYLSSVGYRAVVCVGYDATIAEIMSYLRQEQADKPIPGQIKLGDIFDDGGMEK